jgi:hypothetical protein
MPTGAQRFEAELGMGVVRRDQRHQIHVRFLQHGCQGRVGLNPRKIRLGDCEPGRVDFRDGHGSHAGALHFRQVRLAHVKRAAVSDNAHFEIADFHVGEHLSR